jgi:toxin ParE1/3/4
MSGFVLSPAAQGDLDAIWDYTADRWSVEQANRYVLAIGDACQQLADGMRRSEAIEDIGPGYRKSSVASHVVFFRIASRGPIDVVRILHQRMDPAADLHGDEFID